MMLIIKIIAISFTALTGILQIFLDYIWKDKHTKSHKYTRILLIVFIILGAIAAMSVVIYDDIKTEKALSDAAKREYKAEADRASIQAKLNIIENQMTPIIDIATAKYPNLSLDEALKKYSQELKKIDEKIEKTKSTTHSFSTEITFYLEANWADGKLQPIGGIMATGPTPSLKLKVVKTSGNARDLELHMDGLASRKKEGKIVTLSYKAKALPSSWIFGQDYRDIKGYSQISAVLYGINRSVTTDARILIKKMIIEVFINGQSTAIFNKNININFTLPEGEGNVGMEIKLPEIIQSKKIL